MCVTFLDLCPVSLPFYFSSFCVAVWEFPLLPVVLQSVGKKREKNRKRACSLSRVTRGDLPLSAPVTVPMPVPAN
jgi:hypothetical protein